MTSITLTVTGAKARATVSGPLTSGMVGIPVTIEYDDAWNGLTKNLVCRCGPWGPGRGETRTVLSIGKTATVAHEVMQADMYLYLGIEGYSADGKLVMPTTWAECGIIQPGANAEADPSANPKLPFWAQLQMEIEKIKQHAVPDERIAAAVASYLKENPISSQNGSGLTDAEKVLILSLFRNAAYTSADMADALSQLESLWSGSGGDSGGDDTHSHSYTSSVTKAATCNTDGVITYTCSCGHSYTQSIPATGHNYVDGACANCGAADPDAGISTGVITPVWTDGKNIFNGIIDAAGQSVSDVIDVSAMSTITITTESTSWFSVPKCHDASTFVRIMSNESVSYMGGAYAMEVTFDVTANTSIRIACETNAKTKIVVKGE